MAKYDCPLCDKKFFAPTEDEVFEKYKKHFEEEHEKEETKESTPELSQQIEKLFVNRNDIYAQAFLDIKTQKMGYKRMTGLIDNTLIQEHLDQNLTLGVYQMEITKVKWGCADFDLNTKKDFDNAKKLYDTSKKEGYNPLMEMSGGGEYKCHVWFFSHAQASDMKFYIEDLCEKAKIQPHEIFPKQTQIKKEDYGNLVKLPLGLHLLSKRKSTILDDDFKEITDKRELIKKLQNHIDNLDDIPKVIIKEKPQTQLKQQGEKPSEFDKFFDYVLSNELPEGKTKSGKYQKIVGINDNILKNLAIWLYKKGYTIEQLTEEIKPIYDEKGWVFGDLIGWFKKTEKGDITEISIGELAEWCRTYLPDTLKLLPRQDAYAPSDFFSKHTEGNKEGQIKTFMVKEMADYILGLYSFKVIKGNDKQIYFYENGYYQENGIALIKNIVTKILSSLFKEHYVNEVLAYIKNLSYVDVNTIEKKLINLKNGLLNPMTREFIPHSPKFFCLNQLPIEYDKKAKCDFFCEELKKKCDEDWKYDLTQEMFGYCLSEDDKYEKAFLLYGEARTMKSTTLYVLENLLGQENITSMSLQQITEDKHAAAFLLSSVANVCAELSPKELRNTNMFMKIVGRDSITAGKKFEQEITFRPQTKLIFSCNTIPSTINKNLAFYRRWCINGFNVQTKIEDVDPGIREKFLTELPGILNWALDGLDRLTKNRGLSYPLSDEETKDLYEKGSDSIQSFIFNCIDVEDDESSEIKRNVRKEYVEFCEKEKLDIVNEIMFGRRFIALTGCGTQKVGKLPGYAGIKFKNRIEVQKII